MDTARSSEPSVTIYHSTYQNKIQETITQYSDLFTTSKNVTPPRDRDLLKYRIHHSIASTVITTQQATNSDKQVCKTFTTSNRILPTKIHLNLNTTSNFILDIVCFRISKQHRLFNFYTTFNILTNVRLNQQLQFSPFNCFKQCIYTIVKNSCFTM
jgi:hypothetical protein